MDNLINNVDYTSEDKDSEKIEFLMIDGVLTSDSNCDKMNKMIMKSKIVESERSSCGQPCDVKKETKDGIRCAYAIDVIILADTDKELTGDQNWSVSYCGVEGHIIGVARRTSTSGVAKRNTTSISLRTSLIADVILNDRVSKKEWFHDLNMSGSNNDKSERISLISTDGYDVILNLAELHYYTHKIMDAMTYRLSNVIKSNNLGKLEKIKESFFLIVMNDVKETLGGDLRKVKICAFDFKKFCEMYGITNRKLPKHVDKTFLLIREVRCFISIKRFKLDGKIRGANLKILSGECNGSYYHKIKCCDCGLIGYSRATCNCGHQLRNTIPKVISLSFINNLPSLLFEHGSIYKQKQTFRPDVSLMMTLNDAVEEEHGKILVNLKDIMSSESQVRRIDVKMEHGNGAHDDVYSWKPIGSSTTKYQFGHTPDDFLNKSHGINEDHQTISDDKMGFKSTIKINTKENVNLDMMLCRRVDDSERNDGPHVDIKTDNKSLGKIKEETIILKRETSKEVNNYKDHNENESVGMREVSDDGLVDQDLKINNESKFLTDNIKKIDVEMVRSLNRDIAYRSILNERLCKKDLLIKNTILEVSKDVFELRELRFDKDEMVSLIKGDIIDMNLKSVPSIRENAKRLSNYYMKIKFAYRDALSGDRKLMEQLIEKVDNIRAKIMIELEASRNELKEYALNELREIIKESNRDKTRITNRLMTLRIKYHLNKTKEFDVFGKEDLKIWHLERDNLINNIMKEYYGDIFKDLDHNEIRMNHDLHQMFVEALGVKKLSLPLNGLLKEYYDIYSHKVPKGLKPLYWIT